MVLALMLCQKHGVPKSACMMAAMALLAATHSIKTGFGISEGTCTSTASQPTHGLGQGSRLLASALWLIVSCVLFSAMDTLCHCASFCDPCVKLMHRRTSDGFVDDVIHWFNLGLSYSLIHDVSAQDIVSGLSRDGQSWERMLWTTGGKLELPKYLCCILFYVFDPDGRHQHGKQSFVAHLGSRSHPHLHRASRLLESTPHSRHVANSERLHSNPIRRVPRQEQTICPGRN